MQPKQKNSIVKTVKLGSSLDAQPTYAHCVLTALERAGYLKHYVQQNHDGLPQKSGFPQDKINEIHGAWYDPSNPVVQFSGSLRSDLFKWMLQMEDTTDFCLCLGTSLSGMNADRMASTPAKKAIKNKKNCLGTVIINLQETCLDSVSSVRLFCKIDDAFRLLCKKMNLEIKEPIFDLPAGDVFQIPYNEKGELDKTCTMTLDLRQGAKIMIPVKGAMNEGRKGMVGGKLNGHWTTVIYEEDGPKSRLLGIWWITAALKGEIEQLPVVNVEPVKVKSPKIYELPSKLQIIQGHHTQVDPESGEQNCHLWTLRLGDPSAVDYVESVTWRLHETFRNPNMLCTEWPFQIKLRGWGTFTVKVEIKFRPNTTASNQTLHCTHELTFQGEGDSIAITEVALPKK